MYQFELDGILFPVAAAYLLPKAGDSTPVGCEKVDTDNLPTRRRLHAALGLPMDRPLLRVANARVPLSGVEQQQQQPSAGPVASRLPDVHIGLPPSGAPRSHTRVMRVEKRMAMMVAGLVPMVHAAAAAAVDGDDEEEKEEEREEEEVS